MKPRRVILVGVGVIVLFLVIGAALAFNSGVQTWAARRALAAQPDIRGEIGRVDVGLQHVRAEAVRLELSGMTLQLPLVEADLSVVRAAREQIQIRRLVARGWTLDLTAPVQVAGSRDGPRRQEAGVSPLAALAQIADSTGATTTAGFPVADLLAALELPMDLLGVDGVELEGTVVYPTGPETPAGRAAVTITGGGLAPDREGTFTLTANSDFQDQAAPVSRLRLQSQVVARMRNPRRFAHIATTSSVEASGGQLERAAQLQINATAGSAAQGGAYALELRTPQKALLDVQARPIAPDSTDLEGEWQVAIDDTDVAPFSLSFALPQFRAEGAGNVQFSGTDNSISAAGDLTVNASRLEALQPQLQGVEPLTATARFGARRAGDDVRVTEFRVTVAGARPVVEMTSLQGLEFNLTTGELRVADPESDLVEIQLQGLPLEWAQPFLTGFAITGGPAQGSWRAAARDGGFVLRATAPLRVGGISVAQVGKPLVRNVDLAMSVSGEYVPAGWQARIEQGHLQSGTARLLTFDGRAGQASAEGAALVTTNRFKIEVASVLGQPVAEPYRMVQSGLVSGEFIAAISDRLELAAEMGVTGLTAMSGEVLPKIQLRVRADRAADGRMEAYVPVQVTRDGRASDLTLNAQAVPEGDLLQVDASLTGQHVFVQDVQLLAAPFAGGEETAPVEEPSVEAPWSGLRGKLVLAFGTVVYSDALRASNVEGEITISPELLNVARLQAALGTGGTLDLTGGLNFEAGAEAPFSLKAEVVAKDVEVGELMRVVSPGSPPPVEGRFDLTSSLNGRATDLALLAEATSGEARLSSRGGTLRALPLRFAEAARTGGTLADVVGVIGGLTGNSRVQRVAEASKAASEFAQAVGALAFDQLNIEVARVAGGEIAIKDVSLISPMIRLLGSGGIATQPGTPFWQDPLSVRLQLSARGAVAQHLRTLRLLQSEADPLGYVAMVEDFNLEGSLLNLSAPHLQSLISRALSSL